AGEHQRHWLTRLGHGAVSGPTGGGAGHGAAAGAAVVRRLRRYQPGGRIRLPLRALPPTGGPGGDGGRDGRRRPAVRGRRVPGRRVSPLPLPSPLGGEGSDRQPLPRGKPSMDLSVVIPIKDERDNLAPLHERLRQALQPLGLSYEILFVDDGSTD